jgi:hypothetical protein
MRHSINQRLAIVLVVATAMPGRGFAAGPAGSGGNPQPVIRDVELGYGGVAKGLVVDAHGVAASNVEIELHTSGRVVHATSDEMGKFSVSGLEGGPCIVKVGEVPYGCRLWTTGTAPPKSLQSFAVVHKASASVRAQSDPFKANANACDTGGNAAACVPDACDAVGAAKESRHLCCLSGMTAKQVALLLGVAAAATVAIVLAVEDEGDASL